MNTECATGVRIKICGMTNFEDAAAAAELGANAIGFVFATSPRQVSPEKVREIMGAMPLPVKTVGVFVNEDPDKVASIASSCRLDLLQFHGEESVTYCRQFVQPVIKAVRVRSVEEVEECSAYSAVVNALLLDSHVPGQKGGTGRVFDWGLAVKAKRYGQIILAGGLNPDNVAAAIRAVRPYAVDASSGLEHKPGLKDHDKMARFIQAVRRAEKL